MNKLTSNKAAPLVLLCLSVDIFLPVFNTSFNCAQISSLALLFVLILQLIVVELLIKIDFKKILSVKHISFALSIIMIINIGALFVRMERFYRFSSSEALPIWVILLLTVLLFIFTSSVNNDTLARAGGIAIAAILLSVLILLFANINHSSISRINYMSIDVKKIGKAIIDYMYFPVDILLYFCISEDDKIASRRCLFTLLISVSTISILICVIRELVLGDSGDMMYLHTLARLGGLSVFKRIEAIHIFVWILAALIKLSALFFTSANLLKSVKYSKKSTFVFCIVIWLAFVAVMYGVNLYWQKVIIQISGFLGAAIIILCCARKRAVNEKSF
ncbi:MAG: hypothetical protein RR508_02325 [Oscillospiraceae bacterium]